MAGNWHRAANLIEELQAELTPVEKLSLEGYDIECRRGLGQYTMAVAVRKFRELADRALEYPALAAELRAEAIRMAFEQGLIEEASDIMSYFYNGLPMEAQTELLLAIAKARIAFWNNDIKQAIQIAEDMLARVDKSNQSCEYEALGRYLALFKAMQGNLDEARAILCDAGIAAQDMPPYINGDDPNLLQAKTELRLAEPI